MKKILTTFLLLLSLTVMADNNPLWMRHCAISPDGQFIAFSYKGDIFTVPVNGGKAKQLTTNPAYDSYPIWSKDGNRIAFASYREGSMDIFTMPKDGGVPVRVTTNSADELPMAFIDNENILFSSTIRPTSNLSLIHI